MRECPRCKVDIYGSHERCPLCRNELSEAPLDEDIFPIIATVYRQHITFFRVLLFICVSLCLVSFAVNILLDDSGLWSLFVAGGTGCLWLILWLAIKKKKNIPKGLLYQVAAISVIAVLWDIITGWDGWSVDFIIPGLCISTMIALAVLSIVLHWDASDLIVYIGIDALFGIIPIIFYLTGLLNVAYPSIICVTISLISILALAVFSGDHILGELKRRFHV